MTAIRTYSASCHCGSFRFRFRSEEITEGRRCNCSICIRKGTVMSARYFPPEDFEEIQGMDSLSAYCFGDEGLSHCFCRTCGISPFSLVVSVPLDYDGPAKPGYYRINLGCVHDLDVYGLTISILDGKSF